MAQYSQRLLARIRRADTQLSLTERLVCALRVAAHHREIAAIEHYGHLLLTRGAIPEDLVVTIAEGVEPVNASPRVRAVLRQADRMLGDSAAANPADHSGLTSVGLGPAEFVTVCQSVGFVDHQIRLRIGRALLQGAARIAPREFVDRTGTRVIAGAARVGPSYLAALALDPAMLEALTSAQQAIARRYGGLASSQRALCVAVTSRITGCPPPRRVGTGTHAPSITDDSYEVDIPVKIDSRWWAVVDFAAALAKTPVTATQQHVSALRQLGFDDFEILDIVRIVAVTSWTNRLLLALGELAATD